MPVRYRGIPELFNHDPDRVDRLVRGSKADSLARRGFLKGSGQVAMSPERRVDDRIAGGKIG